ncbi:MAG: hypothetical protein LDL41_08430 [Coleofasciculus sp. S288]|nr:hypothetical protein [Coleofasciculus sp. S288]
MNTKVLQGELTAEEMARIVNHHALMELPAIDTLNSREAWQILTLLGIFAASVERHAQQAVRRQASAEEVIPGRGIAMLLINGKQPFLEYFQALADRLNHPHRDSFITYIEMNGPCAEVTNPGTGQPLYRLGDLFEDGAFLTFTGNVQEKEFITLLKKSVSLQGAANLLMEEALNHPEGLQARKAIQSLTTAATFMFGIRDLIADFIRRAPFSTDFFLDEFRQYAIPWYADRKIKASSAANDDSALLRDLILFTELIPPREGFSGFRSHVRATYHVLLPDAVARLERAMNRESLEVRVSQALQLDLETLLTLNESQIAELLQNHPWLAACLVLYRAQSEASKTHFSTIMKYLVWPKRKRDKTSDPREQVTVVPNVRGSTGMEPMGIMMWLDQARAHHPLAVLGHRSSVMQLCSTILEQYSSHPIEMPFEELVTFYQIASRTYSVPIQ